MSVSILEALQCVEINLSNGPVGVYMAKMQIHNAVGLLEKGYNIWTQVDPLLEQYGTVENVPELSDNPDMNQDD